MDKKVTDFIASLKRTDEIHTFGYLALTLVASVTGRDIRHITFHIEQDEGLAEDGDSFNLSGEGLIALLALFSRFDTKYLKGFENAPPSEYETLDCDMDDSVYGSDAIFAILPLGRVIMIHRDWLPFAGLPLADLNNFFRALNKPQLFNDYGDMRYKDDAVWLRKHAGLLYQLNFITDVTKREIDLGMPHEAIERMLADERVKHSNPPMPQNVPPMPMRTD